MPSTRFAKIGLLSDSHGRALTTRLAVEMLLAQGVDCLIHLGDLGCVEVIDELLALPPGGDKPLPVRLVFGNVDWDADSMARYAASVGVQVDHPAGRLTLADGRVLAFMHGDDGYAMQQALADGVAFLCHGHSHRQRDEKRGATRIINPGALFRAAAYSVAVLDTATDAVAFHRVVDSD